MSPFGIEDVKWDKAKDEGTAILKEYAKQPMKRLTYSDFARKLQSIQLEPHDPRLFELLGEISTEENAAGRGMLSALVVHKDGDGLPGPGFFELAHKLGYDTRDKLTFWVKEVERVFAAWSR